MPSFERQLDDIRMTLGAFARNEEVYESDEGATFDDIIRGASSFAERCIAPVNRIGDRTGARLEAGRVSMPPGWREAYSAWIEAGWAALSGPEVYGGQGMPQLVAVACGELWHSASTAFALNPMLTMGAVEALRVHASEELKLRYLPQLVSGQWSATMNLTESDAGSDLSRLRTRAERRDDGTYTIRGQKNYISYGEHDLSGNIIHLVLARVADAPEGTRGISLFLVPRNLPEGKRNDVVCAGLEHKLGLHASPTCTMVYGERDGAVGWLVGEENRGLACMFAMMNSARLHVGVQGLGVASASYGQALAFALGRHQGPGSGDTGGAPAPIAEHPDVKRMLLDMRARTAAVRALAMATAQELDQSHRDEVSPAGKLASQRASVLVPLLKAFATDTAFEVSSLALQVHGGMGYVEETGIAQNLRDVRAASIYEGTNGIQAIDLVIRKLALEGGQVVESLFRSYEGTVDVMRGSSAELSAAATSLERGIAVLREATEEMGRRVSDDRRGALASARAYLDLHATIAAASALARVAVSAPASVGGPLSDAARRAVLDCLYFSGTRVEVVDAAARIARADARMVDDWRP